MLPCATPNTTSARQPLALVPPSAGDRLSDFHEPVTTLKAIRMVRATRTTRRSGNRSASTADLGRATVPAAPPPRCCLMSTPGPGPHRSLDAAEHRVGADREVGLPVRPLQVGL